MIDLTPGNEHRTVHPRVDIHHEHRPGTTARPWVMTNMVSSLDGGTAVEGLSGPLGGPADQQMFGALREVPSVILVGAATVNAEEYRAANPNPESQRRRLDRGLPARATIAIVSSSLQLDPTLPLLHEPGYRPIVLTSANAPTAKRNQLADKVDIIESGDERVDLREAIRLLGERGHTIVLAEGGPRLNGQLVADDLIDEWNMTLSPTLVAGESARPAVGSIPATVDRFELSRLWLDDHMLFGRWTRRQ